MKAYVLIVDQISLRDVIFIVKRYDNLEVELILILRSLKINHPLLAQRLSRRLSSFQSNLGKNSQTLPVTRFQARGSAARGLLSHLRNVFSDSDKRQGQISDQWKSNVMAIALP